MSARPDPALTPGVAGSIIVRRDVPGALKRRVFERYGINPLRRPLYVIDHLIPLELRGTNDIANLWPQPRLQARQKDRDEDAFARAVRYGGLSYASAQGQILALWGGARWPMPSCGGILSAGSAGWRSSTGISSCVPRSPAASTSARTR